MSERGVLARPPFDRIGSIGRRAPGVVAPGDRMVVVGGGGVILVALVAFWAFATSVSPDAWVPVVLLVVITAVSVPICLMASRGPREL